MKPPPLDYIAPATLEEALSALAGANGTAKVLAGGQSLMPLLNFRLARPTLLVDINRLPGLGGIRVTDEAIHVGALVRHHALETSAAIAEHLPIVTAAMAHVAHLAVRNRGTIGGSLAHADPAAELPMLARLLDARITIRSPAAERTVEAADFVVSALTTVLAADEIVRDIAFPRLPAGTGWGFLEVARRDGDFALAAAGALLRRERGAISAARIALMGVGETALRVEGAEAALVGRALDADALDAVVAAVREGIAPTTDLHASADYRRHLAGVLARRALQEAWRRAGGSP